jgi:hypothetical protein
VSCQHTFTLMSQTDKTGESGPDFTHYDELLQQARTKNDEVQRTVAAQFVPLLYTELKEVLGLSPFDARLRIVADCVPMWAETSILHILPKEAKDEDRAKGGDKSAAVRKARSVTTKKHKILLNHRAITEIGMASIASTDGSVWIYLNPKYDYIAAEAVTRKSVTTEPLTVKSSSAPIRLT